MDFTLKLDVRYRTSCRVANKKFQNVVSKVIFLKMVKDSQVIRSRIGFLVGMMVNGIKEIFLGESLSNGCVFKLHVVMLL